MGDWSKILQGDPENYIKHTLQTYHIALGLSDLCGKGGGRL